MLQPSTRQGLRSMQQLVRNRSGSHDPPVEQQKCAWYKKGKLRAFYRPIKEEDSAEDGGKDIEVSAAMASLDVGDLHDEGSSRCEIDIL